MPEPRVVNAFRVKWFGVLVLAVFAANVRPAAHAKTAKEKPDSAIEARVIERSATLWRQPDNMAGRDLFHGIGGTEHAPVGGPYTFVKEDAEASSPKFVVKDSNGVKWKVKLGAEARGEIAATRLVWAVGFFTDEDYYLPRLQVKDMPVLRRGKEFVSPDGSVRNVRMERESGDVKKVGLWKWKGGHGLNPRELNDLKVMMALINNWDLKDVNNSIYKRPSATGETEYIYVVSDLGASFGQTHLDRQETKSDLNAFQASRFIAKASAEHVRFATPGGPTPYLLINPKDYFYRRSLMSVTRNIPRTEARRMGDLLAQLSSGQIRDAFRAGGFSSEEADGFARVIEQRIDKLRQL